MRCTVHQLVLCVGRGRGNGEDHGGASQKGLEKKKIVVGFFPFFAPERNRLYDWIESATHEKHWSHDRDLTDWPWTSGSCCDCCYWEIPSMWSGGGQWAIGYRSYTTTCERQSVSWHHVWRHSSDYWGIWRHTTPTIGHLTSQTPHLHRL